MDTLTWANGGWKSSVYLKTYSGVGTGIDVDGLYGFQCKDFVDGCSREMGVPFSSGNAIVLLQPQEGWTQHTDPQIGDVYVKSFIYQGNNFGDTGIVTGLNGNNVTIVAQNQSPVSLDYGSPPIKVTYPLSSFKMFLRSDTISNMTEQEAYAGVSAIHRGMTDVDPEPNNADAWAKRFLAAKDPGELMDQVVNFANGLGASDYKGDPQFRYKGRHYDEDMETKYQQGIADSGAKDPKVIVNEREYIPK